MILKEEMNPTRKNGGNKKTDKILCDTNQRDG